MSMPTGSWVNPLRIALTMGVTGRPSARSGTGPRSFAEHADLGVGLVHLDGHLVERVDQLLDVLRLEPGQVDRDPGPLQFLVRLAECLWRDQPGELDTGAQQL